MACSKRKRDFRLLLSSSSSSSTIRPQRFLSFFLRDRSYVTRSSFLASRLFRLGLLRLSTSWRLAKEKSKTFEREIETSKFLFSLLRTFTSSITWSFDRADLCLSFGLTIVCSNFFIHVSGTFLTNLISTADVYIFYILARGCLYILYISRVQKSTKWIEFRWNERYVCNFFTWSDPSMHVHASDSEYRNK